MKLWNKDDGRAGEFGIDETQSFPYYVKDEFGTTYRTKTLKEIADKWWDYEEPKEHWCVTMYGGITRIKDSEEPIDDLIEIGNYFNSKEDAYDALEKLKAWTRLEDKRIKFYGWRRNHTGTYDLLARWEDRIPRSYEIKKDLDLLFGGDE